MHKKLLKDVSKKLDILKVIHPDYYHRYERELSNINTDMAMDIQRVKSNVRKTGAQYIQMGMKRFKI